jgi:hypothetical protein
MYWKKQTLHGVIHTLHVHVRAKKANFPLVVDVSLHAFEALFADLDKKICILA